MDYRLETFNAGEVLLALWRRDAIDWRDVLLVSDVDPFDAVYRELIEFNVEGDTVVVLSRKVPKS